MTYNFILSWFCLKTYNKGNTKLQWTTFLSLFLTVNTVRIWYIQHDIFIDSFDHNFNWQLTIIRSSRPELFLGKGALKICSKFTGEHPCRRAKQFFWNRTSTWVFSCKFGTPLGGCFCILEGKYKLSVIIAYKRIIVSDP